MRKIWPASFVHIALDDSGSFTVLHFFEGDTIGHLADRACVKFPHWGTADNLSLYLVAKEGDATPTPSAVASAHHLKNTGWSLLRAEVLSGAWLVARINTNNAAVVAAKHYWLTAVILRVGNSLFSASSGMENMGVSSSQWATTHESRVLDGRQEHDSNVGGHLLRRMLNFGVDSGENVEGTLKEE